MGGSEGLGVAIVRGVGARVGLLFPSLFMPRGEGRSRVPPGRDVQAPLQSMSSANPQMIPGVSSIYRTFFYLFSPSMQKKEEKRYWKNPWPGRGAPTAVWTRLPAAFHLALRAEGGVQGTPRPGVLGRPAVPPAFSPPRLPRTWSPGLNPP